MPEVICPTRLGKNSIKPQSRRNSFANVGGGTQVISLSPPRSAMHRTAFYESTAAVNSCPASSDKSPFFPKTLSTPSEKHKSFGASPKSALSSVCSVPLRGARDRHGRWQRNAVDAACRSVCHHARTNGLSRTVKSYGSDTPTLVSRLRRRSRVA
jgi:hypothetical protein